MNSENTDLPELAPGTRLSLPQAFLLLCLKEKEGTLLADTLRAQHGLAGAILAELALTGAVTIEEGEGPEPHRERRFRLRRTQSGHDVHAVYVHVQEKFAHDDGDGTFGGLLTNVCANALAKIRRSRHLQTATDWVSDLAPAGLRHLIAEPLVQAGILDRRKRRLWGIIPLTSYPEVRPEVEERLREHIGQRIAGAHQGTAAAVLLGLLQATGLTRKVLGTDVDQEQVSEIVCSAALPTAVQEAVQAAYFATVSSVAATGTDLS
ncbi:GOLPH3/VPS74 family protein [Micrococcoides hystricis]|uniref:GPP34 family phosphoprotein n=1 Tax=Micrococcoides hystricis TaxID=1572761 RepID=A0ABV6P7Q3_9MICC